MSDEHEDGALEEGAGRSEDTDQKVVELNARWQRKHDALLKEKRELESQVNGEESKIEERERFLDRKQKAIEMAVERNIAPAEALSLLGLDNADDEARLDAIAERDSRARLEERQTYARKHGRKAVDTARLRTSSGSYQDMLAMSDEQIKRMPESEISRRIDQASKTEGSLRTKLRNQLGGS